MLAFGIGTVFAGIEAFITSCQTRRVHIHNIVYVNATVFFDHWDILGCSPSYMGKVVTSHTKILSVGTSKYYVMHPTMISALELKHVMQL